MADGLAVKPFLNRELSWLEFNQRVLEEALDPANPLLERLKFFTIASSNLDEFFEVRVAGLKQQIESGNSARSVDGLTPPEIFTAISRRVQKMVGDQYVCWHKELQPALAKHKIRLLEFNELEPADLAWLKTFYLNQVHPVLTPLAIDPAHPFPQLLNKSLNLIVWIEMPKNGIPAQHLAVVERVASKGYVRSNLLFLKRGGPTSMSTDISGGMQMAAAAQTVVSVGGDTEALIQEFDARAEQIRAARMKGYEGDACPECGNFTLVRNGTCLKCDTCGGTTGCS